MTALPFKRRSRSYVDRVEEGTKHQKETAEILENAVKFHTMRVDEYIEKNHITPLVTKLIRGTP